MSRSKSQSHVDGTVLDPVRGYGNVLDEHYAEALRLRHGLHRKAWEDQSTLRWIGDPGRRAAAARLLTAWDVAHRHGTRAQHGFRSHDPVLDRVVALIRKYQLLRNQMVHLANIPDAAGREAWSKQQ